MKWRKCTLTVLVLTITCGMTPYLYDLVITSPTRAVTNDQRPSLNHTYHQTKVVESMKENKQPRRLTAEEVGHRFENRRQQLDQACRKYGNSSLFRRINSRIGSVGAYWPVMNTTVTHCLIEKTGSTTWSGYFRSLREKMEQAGIHQSQNASNMKQIKFVFVRDPYQRLLSAYVDKLFGPNTLFWEYYGSYIVKNFRPNPSNLSLACGHDVTFPEFIRYVIHSQETGARRDGHFVPIHDHCYLCAPNVSYDYIGHMETLNEDMPYLIKLMQSPVNHSTNFDESTIRNNANWVLQVMTSKIRTCMSMKEACLRLWKKWQVRGILSKKEPLPVTAEEAEVISMASFVNRSLQALARSGPKWERSLQKTEALREAFASVPLEDRLKMQNLLFLDFELFGFDPSPGSIFPTTTPDPRDDSDYHYWDPKKSC